MSMHWPQYDVYMMSYICINLKSDSSHVYLNNDYSLLTILSVKHTIENLCCVKETPSQTFFQKIC